MFGDSKFNGDISKWDVSNVTNMCYMFSYSQFNGDISKWNVSNVTNMEYMYDNSKFNGDISNWNISNVKKGKDKIEKYIKEYNEKLNKAIDMKNIKIHIKNGIEYIVVKKTANNIVIIE
jgi:surface protein